MGKTLVTAQLVCLCCYRKVSSLGLVGRSQDIPSAGNIALVFLALMHIVAINSLLIFLPSPTHTFLRANTNAHSQTVRSGDRGRGKYQRAIWKPKPGGYRKLPKYYSSAEKGILQRSLYNKYNMRYSTCWKEGDVPSIYSFDFFFFFFLLL